MAYDHVNGAWEVDQKELPALTYKEAITASKRLYRLMLKRKCPWKFRETTGKRWGGLRHGTLAINCGGVNGYSGWWILVHNLSHIFSHRLHPNAPGHGHQHAFVEKTMIEHVRKSGWLAGKLARPTKDRPPVDRRALKRSRLAARLAAWTAKRARADRAMTKLRRSLAAMDRRAATFTGKAGTQ